MSAFLGVLLCGGWVVGVRPSPGLLAMASGAAFTSVVVSHLANALACRSESRWFGALAWRSNPLLLWALTFEVGVLALLLGCRP